LHRKIRNMRPVFLGVGGNPQPEKGPKRKPLASLQREGGGKGTTLSLLVVDQLSIPPTGKNGSHVHAPLGLQQWPWLLGGKTRGTKGLGHVEAVAAGSCSRPNKETRWKDTRGGRIGHRKEDRERKKIRITSAKLLTLGHLTGKKRGRAKTPPWKDPNGRERFWGLMGE